MDVTSEQYVILGVQIVWKPVSATGAKSINLLCDQFHQDLHADTPSLTKRVGA